MFQKLTFYKIQGSTNIILSNYRHWDCIGIPVCLHWKAHWLVVDIILLYTLLVWFLLLCQRPWRKRLAYLIIYSPSPWEAREEAWGRNLEAETKAELMEEQRFVFMNLVAHSSWLIQFIFLYNPEPPSQGWHYSQYGRPSHINHWSIKWPHRLAYRLIQWRHFFS